MLLGECQSVGFGDGLLKVYPVGDGVDYGRVMKALKVGEETRIVKDVLVVSCAFALFGTNLFEEAKKDRNR